DQRDFGHHGPTERFGFQRDTGTAGTGDSEASGIACADGHGNRGNFVLTLDECAAVFGQFAAQSFHNVGPGSDGIAGAETDTGGNQTVSQGFVAVRDDLMTALALALDKLEGFKDVAQRVTVAGMESSQSIIE